MTRYLVKDDGPLKSHEHFCHLCFNGTKVRKRRGGWWRCVDEKCVKLPSTLCKKHDAALRRREERRADPFR